MEKRTLLAVVISLVILLVWDYFYIKPNTPEQPPQQIVKQEAPAPEKTPLPDAIEVPSPAQETQAPALQQQKAEPIVIETPLYRATWSTEGATLRSFQLKKYRENVDPSSKTVELVKTPVPLIGIDDTFTDASVVYAVDKLGQSSPGAIPEKLVFTAQLGQGITLKKIYAINPAAYGIGFSMVVENNTAQAMKVNARLFLDELFPRDKETSSYIFEGPMLLLEKHLEEFKVSKVEDVGVYRDFPGQIQWFGFVDQYFIETIIPKSPVESTLTIKRINENIIRMSYVAPSITLQPGAGMGTDYILFLGPKELETLKSVGYGLNKALDFGFFDIIAKPLLRAMNWIYGFTRSFGLSIIILTIIIKILLYPLTLKSFKSMKELQKIQPLMKEVQAKYKEDKQKLNQEMMKLYSEHKINPMGGCLPMLLQIPILFALYKVFYAAIELRHTPFYMIGTWLPDLSAKDPYYITPILMGLSQFVMQKMSPTPGDAMQQKMMLFMPVIFTVLFLNFPSGLVIYWLVSNVLSIAQQAYINRKHT